MKSISWPKMFSKNTTKLKEGLDATTQNLGLLLQSEVGELQDDPYFGLALKQYLFDPNNIILRDILIDEIYTKIATFMPQLFVERKDITIVQDGVDCNINIRALNKLNYITDMYNLVLKAQEE